MSGPKYGDMPKARKQRVAKFKLKVKGLVPLKSLMQGKLKIK